MLMAALVAGCTPTGGSTESGYTENDSPYQRSSVTWEPFKDQPQQVDTNQPLQTLPPDVQHQMRSTP
jgi:hypothetical protein